MKNPKVILRILAVTLFITVLFFLFLIKNGKFLNSPSSSDGMGTNFPEFSFKDQHGQSYGLSDLKGKIWISNFIFTRCEGPCPILTRQMAFYQEKYGKNDDFRLVSFSVDPDYDTPSVLKKYAKEYGANYKKWRFLTGPFDAMTHLIVHELKLGLAHGDSQGHGPGLITHTQRLLLTDQKGEIQGYYHSNDSDSLLDLEKRLARLLKKT